MSNTLTDTVKEENQALATKELIDESMAVRLSCLDNMLDLAGEVIIVSSNLNAISHDIREGTTVSKNVSEDIKDLAITSNRISSDLHSLVSNVRTVTLGDLFNLDGKKGEVNVLRAPQPGDKLTIPATALARLILVLGLRR